MARPYSDLPVEQVDPATLRAAEYNPRRMSKEQNAQLRRSLERFGLVEPLVVNRHPDRHNVVIGGHQRLRLARALGYATVPVVFVTLDHEKERELNLRLNRNLGEFDWELLKAFDVAFLREAGFVDNELRRLIQEAADDEFDTTPPRTPSTKAGDVYRLGRHRLVCGDATNPQHVSTALGGATPHLMVTDPPYGVDYDPNWRAAAASTKGRSRLPAVANDDQVDWSDAWRLFTGDVAYVWHAGRFASAVQQSLATCGLEVRAQLIWAKDRFAMSRGSYHWQHEPCWYAVRTGCTARWVGGRHQTTVWSIQSRDGKNLGHPTQKPVECMERPIRNHGQAGDVVYDPFLGSGTTLIACERSDRSCVGLELAAGHCDVIVARWESLTGKKAERASA